MLKIINNMKPFFENCYARINVRQYARLTKVTPPTASSLLKYYEKEGILLKEKDRNYIMFYANRDSKVFISLSRIYWQYRLQELIKFIENKTVNPTIILFGSLAKAETKPDSDIDLAIFADEEKIDLSRFRKELKREIQVFWCNSLKDIKNKELMYNILNGHVVEGRLKL